MPTAYIPFQLVHAHFPSSSSAHAAYQELRVKSSRSFPSAHEAYSESLHPAHAISVAHDSATGILARVIQKGYVLELRNLSLVVDPTHAHSGTGAESIRISFPDPLRPVGDGSIIAYVEEGRFYIVVVSEEDVLYRLKFSLGSFSGPGDRVAFKVKGDEDWCEEWEIPQDTIAACGGVGAIKVNDEDTVILGVGDGGIVRLTRSVHWGRTPSWSASHHRAASKFRLPSLFTRSSTDEQIISLCTDPSAVDTTVIYTLSRDYKLRSWDAFTGSPLRAVDIRTSISPSQDLVLHYAQTATHETPLLPATNDVSYCRVVAHPSETSRYSHLIVTFVATPLSSSSAGSFLVFRVTRYSGEITFAGDKPCSSTSGSAALRGFEIIPPMARDHSGTGWRLLVAWDKRGAVFGESVCMDDIFQFSTFHDEGGHSQLLHDWTPIWSPTEVDQMDPAYFDEIISATPPDATDPYDNNDIPQTFSRHLLYPGRFSPLALETALEEYIEQQLPSRQLTPQVTSIYPSRSAKFEAIVGCHLQLRLDAQTGAPVVEAYRQELKTHWLGLWARVRDLDKRDRWPICTETVDGAVVIHTRGGISAFVAQDTATVVAHLGQSGGTEIVHLPDESFAAVPELASREVRHGAAVVSAAGELLTGLLKNPAGQGESANLDDLIARMDEVLSVPASEPIDTRLGSVWDEMIEPIVTEDDTLPLRRILSNIESTADGISSTLHVLMAGDVDSSQTPSSAVVLSGYGNALLSSTIASMITARYQLALGTLLVAIYHLSDSVNHDDDEEALEEMADLLSSVVFVYHRYRVLKWSRDQNGEEGRERTKASNVGARKAAGNDVFTADRTQDDQLDDDSIDPSYSLIHTIIARQSRHPADPSTIAFTPDALAFLNNLGLLKGEEAELEPNLADVQLGLMILTGGHAGLANTFTELYTLSSGNSYVRGRALLELGFIDDAVDCLRKSAAGINDGSMADVVPRSAGPDGVAEYYRHVIELFDQRNHHGPVVYFGQLALRAAKTDDFVTEEIWTKIFLSNIALGLYEDAYSILTASPSFELQRDLLGQLISVMCENNEVGRLNALGFIGLQKQVENLLDFKARNSDPLRYPNYYKVLYSWHISRGDYRSAGEVMYKQGRRFADGSSSKVPAYEMSAMQARSYLAAINCLSLVDKQNAWIGVPAISRPSRGIKRRRVTGYIPENVFSEDKKPIDILTVSDIQTEYSLVLSRLQLSSQMQDLHEHGVSVGPEETVGLLVQRGMYDLALSTAAAMEVDMTELFRSLAKRCVELSRLSDVTGDLSTAAFLQTSPITSRLRGPPSALALRYLQTALSRYDSSKTQYRYRCTVADTLFEINSNKQNGWVMPSWLAAWEMERDPESWISRALKWGWIKEAAEWTSELLRNATPPELLPPNKADVANIPYNLVDRVLAAAGEGDEKDDREVQGLVKALKEQVERRTDRLQGR